MKNKIVLKKHVTSTFVINILTFLLLILFFSIYKKLNYWVIITNIMLILNIVILITGIIFNILFYTNDKKYDNKKSFVIPIVIFVVLQFFNLIGVYIVNKVHDSSYNDMNVKVTTYCDPENYYCDSYEIVRNSNYNDFVAHKVYYDYDNNKNDIEIHTFYNTSSVVKVRAIIYSKKSSYAPFLIKNSVKKYFYNFDYTIDEDKIQNAFDKRYKGSVKDDNKNATYKVEEVYEKNKLKMFKTIIELSI